MEAYLLTKTCEREIGYTGPASETHREGTLIIPDANLYIRLDQKTVARLTENVSQDHMAPEPGIRDSPKNAIEHILKLGRYLHKNDSFYEKIDIDFELVSQIVETRRQIKEGPAKLTQLIQQACPQTVNA